MAVLFGVACREGGGVDGGKKSDASSEVGNDATIMTSDVATEVDTAITIDAGTEADAAATSDADTQTDTASTSDVGSEVDTASTNDTGTDADAASASDVSPEVDTSTSDAGTDADTATTIEAGPETDTAATIEAGTDTDTAATIDAGPETDTATTSEAGSDTPGHADGGCNLGTAKSAGTDQNLSLFGQIVYFANGSVLPPGHYTVSYVDGCMKYAGDQGWAVHAYADGSDAWWLVGDTTLNKIIMPPGTIGFLVGSGGFATFAACVSANLAQPPREFDFGGGKIGVWLQDNPYGDNVAGENGRNPKWQLTYTGVCPP